MSVNVLIVDDSAVMRSMIVKTLRLAGLPLGEIHQSANGQEGLAAINQNWIDLVIVDINMPVMNGEEMIDRMLENPEHKNIPIVVISTEGSKTRVGRLQDKGARFIHKPFSPEKIRDTIKDLLGDGVSDGTEN
ncbi:MAG: response regulator [Desulfobacterales bacterium]|nr:response regulator [Deltaproteobacteria bacterium]NNL76301.1 response regulator [Desulfobacterales bacterium]